MRLKVTDKRQFDISIVNSNVNLKLANLLNPVVKEFKNKSNLCQSNRGFCFVHSSDFMNWVESQYPILYKNLLNKKIRVVEGIFQIDNPIKLPLEESDLHENEWEKFLEKHEEEYFQADGDRREVSKLIWAWAQKNLKELYDFYLMNHSWIEVEDLIIDFTWLQFRHAIDNKIALVERYNYL